MKDIGENGTTPLTDTGLCFGCGPGNPIGLRLKFRWDGDTYLTHYTPSANHQGWADQVHGGMIGLVMDEVLARAALERHGLEWVTAELNVRLVRPARIGRELVFRGQVTEVHRRLIICSGDAVDEQTREIIATGRIKMMPAGKGKQ